MCFERAFVLNARLIIFERAFIFVVERTFLLCCLNTRLFCVERAFYLLLLNARLFFIFERTVFVERAFFFERAFIILFERALIFV